MSLPRRDVLGVLGGALVLALGRAAGAQPAAPAITVWKNPT
jgi:hypothetical protein